MKNDLFDIRKASDFITNQSPETKIYIGADSFRYRQHNEWLADYTVAIVVHIDGKHGCKIFAQTTTEKDYDKKLNRPSIRLMNEVYKVVAVYELIKHSIGTRHCEIHLDINPSSKAGSSCVIDQAIGYIRGVCGVNPKVKPFAFAASTCADKFPHVKNMNYGS